MNCKTKNSHPDSMQDVSQRDKDMDDLLLTLICSLYLNLSRNPENIPDLCKLDN
jgi:phosphate uptake regulator